MRRSKILKSLQKSFKVNKNFAGYVRSLRAFFPDGRILYICTNCGKIYKEKRETCICGGSTRKVILYKNKVIIQNFF